MQFNPSLLEGLKIKAGFAFSARLKRLEGLALVA